MDPKEKKFLLLLTVFLACISILNVISAKLWALGLGGLELTLSAGIIAYWLTFPVTDVVAEVWGKDRAKMVVWLGFLANIIVLALSQIAIHLPPSEIYESQAEFAMVLGAVPVIVLASLCAYLCAQLHDCWAFHYWKQKTGGKHLWLRNNLSTISSQLLDSVVFNGIAFWLFAAERMSGTAFITMTLGYWGFKVAVAVIDTPLVYLILYWITGRWGSEPEASSAAS